MLLDSHSQWVKKGDCSKPMSDVPSTCEHDGMGQCLVGTEFPANMMVRVQGRLREHAEFWLYELQPTAFVSDIVTKGYRLPFMRMPDPLCQLNNRSAIDNASFVTAAIEDLVLAHCVEECSVCPIVSSPLSVVTNSKGKQRLVLDLRYINQFLPDRKFKYEGLSLVPSLFCRGDFFATFDLKSGYHHIDIHKDSWPYLGFSWGQGVSRRWFVFRVLPFGLSTACYVFTKVLRPLVKRWRSKGIRCLVYIDDGICAEESKEQCSAAMSTIVSDLDRAGFILNAQKSRFEPQQIGTWLGFTLDLDRGRFLVPQEKMERLVASINGVLPCHTVCARVLAGIVGQVISMSLAIGPVAHLHTRALYQVINSR